MFSVVVPAAFIAAEIIYEGGAVSVPSHQPECLPVALASQLHDRTSFVFCEEHVSSPFTTSSALIIHVCHPPSERVLLKICLVCSYEIWSACTVEFCHVARLNRLVVSRVIGQSNFVRTNVALWINLNTAWKRGPRVESRARSGRRRARGRVAALPALTATQCIGEASSRRREHVKFTFDRDRAPVWR
ncbi:hypothetical protein EVAR_103607_1 [Eumeta japonica]|uniref:Uncharacterized protein n=1 Tax=Eumeta variegata TaxID=151549 RepID=A0A4C1Z7R9_EUMVA|nr:hypothetical protein EVAR_103607_1 [Eumeta japonica]